MTNFNRFRWTSRIAVILSGLVALVGFLADIAFCKVLGVAVVAVFLILIGWKTRCPFCRKPLRITPPIHGEEFCPHCGNKIE